MFVHEYVICQMLASGYRAQVLADGEPETGKTDHLAVILAAINSHDIVGVNFLPPEDSDKEEESMLVAIGDCMTPAETVVDFTDNGELAMHWNEWQEREQ